MARIHQWAALVTKEIKRNIFSKSKLTQEAEKTSEIWHSFQHKPSTLHGKLKRDGEELSPCLPGCKGTDNPNFSCKGPEHPNFSCWAAAGAAVGAGNLWKIRACVWFTLCT